MLLLKANTAHINMLIYWYNVICYLTCLSELLVHSDGKMLYLFDCCLSVCFRTG